MHVRRWMHAPPARSDPTKRRPAPLPPSLPGCRHSPPPLILGCDTCAPPPCWQVEQLEDLRDQLATQAAQLQAEVSAKDSELAALQQAPASQRSSMARSNSWSSSGG